MIASSVTGAEEGPATRPLIVGLGGSAGALSALTEFFDALPEQPDEAFVVVLHMPPDEESSLAEILSAHTDMPVRQVTEPTDIRENHVYVAPPDRALIIEEGRFTPEAFDESANHRAPIDQLFRSLAQNGAATVGVVLSGTGSDGTLGLRAVEEAGGWWRSRTRTRRSTTSCRAAPFRWAGSTW